MKAWREAPYVVMRLSEYGGSYKKNQGYKEEGRTQCVVMPGSGKEESETMLQKIMPPAHSRIDISSVSPAFMDSVCFFGYAPDMCGCWPTPNNASMLKVLAHGSFRIIAFALAE
eukprot:8590059-Alexandrium_andersonii.AAC.1